MPFTPEDMMREILQDLKEHGQYRLFVPQDACLGGFAGRVITPYKALEYLDVADRTDLLALEYEDKALAALEDEAAFVNFMASATHFAGSAETLRLVVAFAEVRLQ